MPDDRQCEARIEELPVRGDQGEDQSTERDEDKPVRSPYLGPLQHPGVPEGLGEHLPPPPARMITATGRGFAELDYADDRCHGAGKECNTGDRHGQRHDDRDDLHLRLLLGQRCALSLVRHYAGWRGADAGQSCPQPWGAGRAEEKRVHAGRRTRIVSSGD